MKKILSVLLTAMMVLALTSCGEKTETTTDSDGSEATEKVTRIALLVPNTGDQSYFDVAANGKVLVEEKYGDAVEFDVIEMGQQAADWESANLQAANENYDIIISGNWQFEGAMLKTAAQFPDQMYLNFDYSDKAANEALSNVYGVTYAANQNGFLAGLVAGVKTESNVVGCVGGMDNPGIRQFMAGFIQGVLQVNPEAKVIPAFVGDFADAPKAKEIALNMNAQGADVIWHAAGGSGNGVFEAAADADFWALGVDSDQYQVFKDSKPEMAEHILTSSEKKCDVAILNSVTKMIEGTAAMGTCEVLGINEDGVGLAENEFYLANMTEEQLAAVNAEIEKVKSGDTVVVDALVDDTVYDQMVEQAN